LRQKEGQRKERAAPPAPRLLFQIKEARHARQLDTVRAISSAGDFLL
jgi:hypothetical protein